MNKIWLEKNNTTDGLDDEWKVWIVFLIAEMISQKIVNLIHL